MSDKKPAREPIAEDARIDALEERLQGRTRARRRAQPADRCRGLMRIIAAATGCWRILLGGLLGGCVIGWAFDCVRHTSPWGLLVGLFLGIVVAFRNIIRAWQTRPNASEDQQ